MRKYKAYLKDEQNAPEGKEVHVSKNGKRWYFTGKTTEIVEPIEIIPEKEEHITFDPTQV